MLQKVRGPPLLHKNALLMCNLPMATPVPTMRDMTVLAPESSPPPNLRSAKDSYRNLYFLLFVIGFLLRFAFVLWKKTYVGDEHSNNPFGVEICSIAAHIVRGKGFSSPFRIDTGPTAWIPPVYPYFVAFVFWLFGSYTAASALVILGIQCAIAGATGVVIHALGRRTFGTQIGFFAAWIWTLSPIFFRWAVSWIWDFAASAFLLTAAFVVTLEVADKNLRKHWLLLGALWAIMALTNPALLSVMPFTFLYAACKNYRAYRPWFAHLALSCVLFAALVSPWLIRNALVFHRPVFFRSNFWFEFHLGNYHLSNGMGWAGKHPSGNPAVLKEYAAWGEMAFLDHYKQESLRFVHEYPAEFRELTLHRAWWFWDGTPLHYQANEWWKPWEFWPLSLLGWLGLLFALTRRSPGWFLYAAALIFYPLPYYFVYPVAKYRHAIEPALLLLSVYLVSVLWSEFRGLAHRKA
ncbi:MAG TPA: glycosyltransferase family 39 protein [Candidatus Acidoferrum sp.]|nr:glycosyltransferase family 39 protein [Candidatus Acidoferrum sp.]